MPHRSIAALAGAFLVAVAQAAPLPEPVPEIFSPGVISGPANDAATAFSPDGTDVYFTRSSSALSAILVSHKTAQGWSEPEIASFSGEWFDSDPAMAPDGSYLVFASSRPDKPGEPPIDGFSDGVPQPGRGARLWRVVRTPGGWSPPRLLPPAINDGHAIHAPSIAADDSLWFMKPDGDGRFELFQARKSASSNALAGAYEAPVRASFNDARSTSIDPAVAPDGSFVVFSSDRAPAKGMDLFIVFRQGDGWGCPMHLGRAVNGTGPNAAAHLSPDGRTLFFESRRMLPAAFPMSRAETARGLQRMQAWDDGNANIWSVSLARWLDMPVAERPAACGH